MMTKKVFRHVIGLLLLASLYPINLMAAQDKCTSLLDVNEEIKAHFLGDTTDHKLLLDEQFEDNHNNWPEQATTINNGKKLISTFKVRRGKLFITTKRGKWQLNLPSSIKPESDYFIETCFKTKDYLGIDWGGKAKGNSNTSLENYVRFATNIDAGKFIYQTDTKKGWGYFDPWKKNKAINQKGYNTLSIVKRKYTVALFINGNKVDQHSAPYLYGDHVGFDTPSNGKVEVEYLTVRQVPLKTKSSIDIYRTLKRGSRDAFFMSAEDMVYDLRTNMIWARACRSGEIKKRKSYIGFDDFVYALNKSSAIKGWRLPSVQEYSTIYKRGDGRNVYSSYIGKPNVFQYKLGYMHQVWAEKRYAWTRESDSSGKRFCYDFVYGGKTLCDNQPNMEWEALANRPGPLELWTLLNGDRKPLPLGESQDQLFERVVAAFHANLKEPGEMLFNSLLETGAENLYLNGLARKIVEQKLPLRLAGKLLLAVKESEKNNPAFWAEYAYLAGLANQPTILLRATKELRSMPYDGEFKEDVLDMAAVFEALGYQLLGKEKEALTPILMRPKLKNSLLIFNYLNASAKPLLKDKQRLATLIGVDENHLIGEFTLPEQQAFYNIETGQLIEPIVKAPALEKGALKKRPTKAHPASSPKATVLD